MNRNASRTRRPNTELQKLRINAGLSPNDLAYRAGVSGKTVRLAERGFTPSPRIQYAIARELGKAPLDIWPFEIQRAVAA
jgi:DNA-binding XRE family transcriptional regulator